MSPYVFNPTVTPAAGLAFYPALVLWDGLTKAGAQLGNFERGRGCICKRMDEIVYGLIRGGVKKVVLLGGAHHKVA